MIFWSLMGLINSKCDVPNGIIKGWVYPFTILMFTIEISFHYCVLKNNLTNKKKNLWNSNRWIIILFESHIDCIFLQEFHSKTLRKFSNEHVAPLYQCRNPNFGLATKARAFKDASQEGSPGVTSHAPRSEVGCEGMNPHTPKWIHILGVGVPMDS
jgi:hypothetical protein